MSKYIIVYPSSDIWNHMSEEAQREYGRIFDIVNGMYPSRLREPVADYLNKLMSDILEQGVSYSNLMMMYDDLVERYNALEESMS